MVFVDRTLRKVDVLNDVTSQSSTLEYECAAGRCAVDNILCLQYV